MEDDAKKQAKIADLKVKHASEFDELPDDYTFTKKELVSKIMSSFNKSMDEYMKMKESSYDSQVISMYYMILGAMFSPLVDKEVQETILEDIANSIAENR